MATQWDIVSFGDVTVMLSVFNGVAAIFSDGVYRAAASVVALFVFGITMLGSLADGKQELPIGRLVISFVIYSMAFSTLSTVTIENRYDGTVTTIDNIPIALSVPASLNSSIGFELAQRTEAAFGSTNPQERITERGYLSPLKIIAEYRMKAMNTCPAGADNSTLNGYQFCPSLHYYVSECAMVKAKRDGETLAIKEKDMLSQIKFDSEAFGTKLILADGSSQLLTCKEAYEKIKAMFDSTDFDTMLAGLNTNFGVKTGETVLGVTSDVLTSLSLDAGKNRSFMQTVMANRIMEEGEMKFYRDIGASDYAENLLSSIEQRNYGWTLQGEMFIKIASKLIPLLECILYAATPFIGLMAICGTLGKKTLLLFVQLLAILQLIPIFLVISQDVVMSDFKEIVASLLNQYELGSMAYSYAIYKEAVDALSLGGFIATTIVPALAMALVTGSGMALMGAFKGAAAAPKDTDATPDISGQGGPVTNLGNRNTATVDQFGNQATESLFKEVGGISSSTAFKSAISSAESNATEASKSYNSALKNSLMDSSGSSYSTEQLDSMGHSVASSTSQSQQWAQKFEQSLANNTSLTEADRAQLTGRVSLGMNAFGTGAQMDDSFAEGLSKEAKEVWNSIKSGTASEGVMAELRNGEQYMSQNSEKISTNDTYADTRMRELQSATQEKATASQKYEEMKQAEQSLSMKDEDLLTNLHMKGRDSETMGRAKQFAQELMDKDPKGMGAFFAAKLDEYDGGVNANELEQNTAFLAALGATSQAFDKQGEFINKVWLDDDKYSVDNSAKVENENLAYSGKPNENSLRDVQNNIPTEMSNSITPDNITGAFDKYSSYVDKAGENSALNDFINERKDSINNTDVYESENSISRGAYDELRDVSQRGPEIAIQSAEHKAEDFGQYVSSSINAVGEWLGFAPEQKEPIPDYMKEIPDGDKMIDPVQNDGKTLLESISDTYSSNRENAQSYQENRREELNETRAQRDEWAKTLSSTGSASAAFSEVKDFFNDVGGELKNLSDSSAKELNTFLNDMGYNSGSFSRDIVNFAGDAGGQGREILSELGIIGNEKGDNYDGNKESNSNVGTYVPTNETRSNHGDNESELSNHQTYSSNESEVNLENGNKGNPLSGGSGDSIFSNMDKGNYDSTDNSSEDEKKDAPPPKPDMPMLNN
ncbi:conjugal transfer protein TraG N-terminal domain-containing protein [Vibrio coralliilyticus]|uniref:TraG N-terminal Proteobacteria domain-containing protein n=1 Tax=Vibrio coralliilyticus TaxID=190893 RepID=A0AAP6ZNB7_9VIBR|nr:conjugal transfer protein TraG N-terminal domain-containing protein [Vibrio coralliilyticus]NOI32000.1 hypothetical protein [Vibrio coralliilyticus]NOJ25201.1 hypothetical protein [Vibrio coralliilyticus]